MMVGHKEYPNYAITEDGRVWSYKTKRFIKLSLNRGGYYCMGLSKPGQRPKNHRVHRLVAFAYLGEQPSDKPDINHIDGNKQNNHYTNLEWSNKSLNGSHAYKMGLSTASPQLGEKHGMSKLTNNDVLNIRKLSENTSNKEIGKLYDLNPAYVWKIVTRRSWKHI